ncbi:MAG TPA: imidazoleglycerol-phosphate dehydratase [Acidimicrobiales bacterium]|jgi:imidazoleglycerol-phosphate dehydratase|nr:imidazoleglycerol-phosphate dehydratase [Acidimicrobiales bacterium]
MTTVRRTTSETQVTVELSLGAIDPKVAVSTTEPFFDHMVAALGRYAGFDLTVTATGDLPHHLTEDVALTLGRAILEATPATCARYGTATIPMDDALVTAAIDLGGRGFWGGSLPDPSFDHVLRSLATAAAATLHVVVVRGEDNHHVTEAAMKAVGLALRQAMAEAGSVFSTKGTVAWDVG